MILKQELGCLFYAWVSSKIKGMAGCPTVCNVRGDHERILFGSRKTQSQKIA
jgi:hypothetical protein